MTREDYINTLELDNAELRKENKELKSQLRGTTHCFDEEEHKKLKEEITNLSKDVDMWNAKYNDMFDENKELKEENQTLKKQVENCYCNRTDCSGRIKDSKVYDSLVQKIETQQKEFIEWLEYKIDICDSFLDTIKSDLQETPYGVISANKDITTRIKENETAHKVYKEILQKYKSIIGVSDESR